MHIDKTIFSLRNLYKVRKIKLIRNIISLAITITATVIVLIVMSNFRKEIKLAPEMIEASISFFILLVILNLGLILFKLLRNK